MTPVAPALSAIWVWAVSAPGGQQMGIDRTRTHDQVLHVVPQDVHIISHAFIALESPQTGLEPTLTTSDRWNWGM